MLLKVCCFYVLGVLFAKNGCGDVHQVKELKKETELKVYHYKIPCMGESAQLCFKVERASGETEAFYDAIAGFDYEWGYNYTIVVEEKTVQNVPADASSVTYKLKKVLKREKVAPEQTFELPLQIDGHRFIETKNGVCTFFETIIVETGSYSCSNLASAESAVFKHAGDKAGLVLVRLK